MMSNLKLGRRVYVKNISCNYMLNGAIVLEIGYQKNSNVPVAVFVRFDNLITDWYPVHELREK